MELAQRIKKAREHAGFTQTQLCDLVGISKRALASYEKNASKIQLVTVVDIAEICNVDTVWLLTGQGQITADGSYGSEQHETAKEFFNPDKANRLIDKLLRLEYISESQLDRVEVEIDRLLEIAEDVVSDIKKAEDANWQKDKEQKKEAIMASMGKTQRRKKAAG